MCVVAVFIYIRNETANAHLGIEKLEGEHIHLSPVLLFKHTQE